MLHRLLTRTISVSLLAASLTAGSVWGAEARPNLTIPLAFTPLGTAGQFEAASPRHRMLVSPEGVTLRQDGEQMQLRWVGAQTVSPVGQGLSKVRVNDLTPARRSGERYGQVRYNGLYAGIDAVLYASGADLEFDYVVAPKANVAQLAFRLDGPHAAQLAANGALTVQVGSQKFSLSRPEAYQMRKGQRVAVPVAFRKAGKNTFGFTVGAYDQSLPLVIDPVLAYASFVGGFGYDAVNAVAVGPDGTVWMAGTTNSRDFPQIGDIPTQAAGGSRDVWVARFDPTKTGEASLLYAAYVGADGVEEAKALVVEQGGTVMVGGQTGSAAFPLVGSLKATFAGNTEGFLFRLDPTKAGTETLVFSSILGGDTDDAVTTLAVAAGGRVAVGGTSTGSAFPVSANALQASGQGGMEGFVALVNPATSMVEYATYLGGSSTDIPTRVALNSQGQIYVTGFTNSDNFPIAGDSFSGASQGRGDVFLARIDPNRNGLEGFLYGTYFGGTNLDFPYGLVVDADNVVTISGYTLSADLPTAGNGVQRTYRGGGDGFVMTLNVALPGSAKLTYGTYLGGSSTDVIYGSARDRNGRLLLTGYTYSADFPTSANGLQRGIGGAYDAFVSVLAPAQPAADGIFYSSFWGAAGIETGNAIVGDQTGCVVYVGGSASDATVGLTGSAYSKEIKGYVDAYLAAIDLCK